MTMSISPPLNLHAGELGASRWSAEHLARIALQKHSVAPVLAKSDFQRISDDLDIWDAWPVQDEHGAPVPLEGGVFLWMALGAPRFADPDERHGHARIHLIQRDGRGWRHLGPAMPDGYSPGSREWSGSAVMEPGTDILTLYFTATGRRGESVLTFEQRLFSARARMSRRNGEYRLAEWHDLTETVQLDPMHYMPSDSGTGAVGTIKAFRDPAFFKDPRDDRRYLLFAGSRAATESQFNGVIGAAAVADAGAGSWTLLPPLIDATPINNELERPHIIALDGLYYLFWSTQSHVFDPAVGAAPTGLYGMVADQVAGPWRPLNGSGLVFANPAGAPRQAYSWLVLPDLTVISFVDDWGRRENVPGSRRFGATFAPELRLHLDGMAAGLEP